MLLAQEDDLALVQRGSDEVDALLREGPLGQIDAVDRGAEREPNVLEGAAELRGAGLEPLRDVPNSMGIDVLLYRVNQPCTLGAS